MNSIMMLTIILLGDRGNREFPVVWMIGVIIMNMVLIIIMMLINVVWMIKIIIVNMVLIIFMIRINGTR